MFSPSRTYSGKIVSSSFKHAVLQRSPHVGLRTVVMGARVVGRAHSLQRIHIHAHAQGVHIQHIF